MVERIVALQIQDIHQKFRFSQHLSDSAEEFIDFLPHSRISLRQVRNSCHEKLPTQFWTFDEIPAEFIDLFAQLLNEQKVQIKLPECPILPIFHVDRIKGLC